MKVQGYDKLKDSRVSPWIKKFVDYVIFNLNKDIRFNDYTLIIVEVLRTAERQKFLFSKGLTKTLNSNHIKGLAVDLCFSKSGIAIWNDKFLWSILYGLFIVFIKSNKLQGRWGGDWNGNGLSSDEKFLDSPHFEITTLAA